MTSTKIDYIIDTMFGYTTGNTAGDWYSFSDITLLTMLQDTNILIHPENMRLRFNSVKSIIEISYGVQAEDLSFTSHFGEVSDYTPDSFVDFAEICGIITSSYRSPYGTYYTKYFGYPTKM